MIKYTLICDNQHSFESWFANSAAYDKQVKKKLVTCPLCDSAKVEKARRSSRTTAVDRGVAIVCGRARG